LTPDEWQYFLFGHDISDPERDEFRQKAHSLGANFKIHYMDVPNDAIWERLSVRNKLASAAEGAGGYPLLANGKIAGGIGVGGGTYYGRRGMYQIWVNDGEVNRKDENGRDYGRLGTVETIINRIAPRFAM